MGQHAAGWDPIPELHHHHAAGLAADGGIHNTKLREPAILKREDWDAWLDGTPDEAFACLQQYPDDLRSAWPVSKRVNNPRNNDAALAKPAGERRSINASRPSSGSAQRCPESIRRR